MSEEEAKTPIINPQDQDPDVAGVYKEFPFMARISREVYGGVTGTVPLMIVAGRASQPLADPAITKTGRQVVEMARSSGVIGRIEGTEFAILMPGVTPYQTFDLAIKVSQAIPEAFIGISFLKAGDQPSIFLRRASDALQKSREDTSKNRITAAINSKKLPQDNLPPDADKITLINK